MIVTKSVEFGIKIPTLSVKNIKGSQFIDQMMNFIQNTSNMYTTIWISDHLIPWVTGWSANSDTLECWTTISYLAGRFKNLNFGSAVLCNSFRNPMLLAKMTATLHELTGGRFILGIGAGWNEKEHITYGYDFPRAAVRIEQLEEGIQIIRRMWTEDEVNFEGKYYQVRGARCYPHPDPLPPILIGGGGEKRMLKVVAHHADWWNIHALPIKTLQYKMDVLKTHCSKVERDFNKIKKTLEGFVTISKTRDEANRIPSSKRPSHFCGTPEEIIKQIKRYVELGIEYFILRFLDEPSPEGAMLFAEKVIPELI